MVTKLINTVLSEWAMCSSDGLASGHTTVENIEVLKSILSNRGLSESEVNEVIVEILSNDVKDSPPETPSLSVESVIIDMVKQKKIRKQFADKMTVILKNNPEFINIYNTIPSLAEAIEVYKSGIWEGVNYRKVFEEIESTITHKGLGRGEIVLVSIIKGCVSGGSKSGDLELPGGTVVDVKELDSSKEVLIVTNAIKGYQNLDFIRALHELKSILESEPEATDILLQSYRSTSSKNGSAPKSQPSREIDDGLDEEFLGEEKVDSIESFIRNRNIFEMGSSVFNGLSAIREGLSRMSGSTTIPDTITFKIGGKEKILLLDQADIKNINHMIDSVTSQFDKISMNVASFDDRNAQYLIPILKHLKLFTRGPNAITVESIHSELIKALHYDGIVFVGEKGFDMKYVPKAEMKDYATSPVKFSRISKGVKFKVSI